MFSKHVFDSGSLADAYLEPERVGEPLSTHEVAHSVGVSEVEKNANVVVEDLGNLRVHVVIDGSVIVAERRTITTRTN